MNNPEPTSALPQQEEPAEHERADCEGCNNPDCPCNARGYEGREAVAYSDGFITGRDTGYHYCGSCSHAWEGHDGECEAYMADGSICGCRRVITIFEESPTPLLGQDEPMDDLTSEVLKWGVTDEEIDKAGSTYGGWKRLSLIQAKKLAEKSELISSMEVTLGNAVSLAEFQAARIGNLENRLRAYVGMCMCPDDGGCRVCKTTEELLSPPQG